jgi:transposase
MLTPDPEVAAKGQRRRFTAEYKRRILAELERCKKPGEIAALLRREGLYSSHIASWRGARDRGELAVRTPPRKRGPKPKLVDASAKRIAELERALAKATGRAERAEMLVEAQKKWQHSSRACSGTRTTRQDRRHRTRRCGARRRTRGLRGVGSLAVELSAMGDTSVHSSDEAAIRRPCPLDRRA